MKNLLCGSLVAALLMAVSSFVSARADDKSAGASDCKTECKTDAKAASGCCAAGKAGQSISLKLRRPDDAALLASLSKTTGVTSVETCPKSKFTTVSYNAEQCCPDSVVAAVRKAGYRVSAQKMTFAVDGLSCGACSDKVDKALSKVRGVSESHVCSESKTATVVFNPNRVSSEKLMAVIKSAGFEAKASVN